MLSVKQGGIKYHFFSVWYESTWDWTDVSRAISEHSNHHDNVRYNDTVQLSPTIVSLIGCLTDFLWHINPSE